MAPEPVDRRDVYGNVPYEAAGTPAVASWETSQGLAPLQVDVNRRVHDDRKCMRHGCKAFKVKGMRRCAAHLSDEESS